jgi:hypothetical protein
MVVIDHRKHERLFLNGRAFVSSKLTPLFHLSADYAAISLAQRKFSGSLRKITK